MRTCLDSWAALALLQGGEPAAWRVAEALASEPVMSWINLGEVYYVLHREYGQDAAAETVRDLRPRLRLDLPSEGRVLEAALLKASHPIAYADAFAAATAIAHDAVLLTGDPELLVADAPWRSADLRI